MRHKGRYVSESFQRREDARRWATAMEGRIDRGELATSARARGIATWTKRPDGPSLKLLNLVKAKGLRAIAARVGADAVTPSCGPQRSPQA